MNGKAIPLDAEPDYGGNVRIDAAGTAHVLGPLEVLTGPPGEVRFMPHHATCPNWGKS